MKLKPGIDLATEKDTGRRCLVVDDERVCADVIAMILNQSGYEALSTYSGEGSIEIAKRQKPSFLIIDSIMADMTGIEAAIQIRKMLPDCRILVYSGQSLTSDLLEMARREGMDFDLFARPVHPTQLLEWLRKSA